MQQRPDWSDLDAELDRWASAGRTATLWWRDDDAARLTPALERLIALARRHHAIVHLAVIPARLSPELARLPCRRALRARAAARLCPHRPCAGGSRKLGARRSSPAQCRSGRTQRGPSHPRRRGGRALSARAGAAVDTHRRKPRSPHHRGGPCRPVAGGRAQNPFRRARRRDPQCPLRPHQVEGRPALHRDGQGPGRDRQAPGRPPRRRRRRRRAHRPVHPSPRPRCRDLGLCRTPRLPPSPPTGARAGSTSPRSCRPRHDRAALGRGIRARRGAGLYRQPHAKDSLRALGQYPRLPLDAGRGSLWRGGDEKRRAGRLPRHRLRRPRHPRKDPGAPATSPRGSWKRTCAAAASARTCSPSSPSPGRSPTPPPVPTSAPARCWPRSAGR